MDGNLMDEIFARISTFEEENTAWVKEWENLDNEIEISNVIETSKKWKLEEDKEDSVKIKEQCELMRTLGNNLNEKYTESSVDTVLSFTPLEVITSPVYISGDFNNWSMEAMVQDKTSNFYTHNLKLIKGYEYAYCFYCDGNRIIDFTKQYKEIPEQNNSENNFIVIPNDDTTKPVEKITKNNREIISEEIWKNIPKYQIKEKSEEEFLINWNDLNKAISNYREMISSQIVNKQAKIDKYFNEKRAWFRWNIDSFIKEFKDNFLERILLWNNKHYLIKQLRLESNSIYCISLFDANGIRCNITYQNSTQNFHVVSWSTLFDSSIILSKTESEIILKSFSEDKEHFIKIWYQIQSTSHNNQDLIPYKIFPENVDINQYNINIHHNVITDILHRDSNCFVVFEAVFIGDSKGDIGLVSSSSIKVYTTWYNKDILNILHIHLNDTSQEITIDSEFLENEANILDHKIFPVDAWGKRLNYKLLFCNYKLIKIFYAMSNEYIDEPTFEEIRYTPKGMVKISKGQYKDYFGKIRQFKWGMLARKDKEQTDLKKMKSFDYDRQGHCGDRHLDELPGFISLEVLFYPGTPVTPLEKAVTLSVPICHLIPLSPKEEIIFEKGIIQKGYEDKTKRTKMLNDLHLMFQEYAAMVDDDSKVNGLGLEKLKEIIGNVEKNVEWDEYDIVDDSKEIIEYIKSVKDKIVPILYQKIRICTLSGNK